MANKPVFSLKSAVSGEALYEGTYDKCKAMWQQLIHKQWFDVVNKDTGRPINPKFLYER
jgi:hypothetical protein